MMRRRARRRANWTYSDSQTLQIAGGGGPGTFDETWLLPPGRVQFLLDTLKRSSMTFMGAHLWLDFYWQNTAASTNLPDIDFSIFKTITQSSGGPDVTMGLGQWKQPATPAAITSWVEDDDDGTESFLWQHHIKGFSPPNALVQTYGAGSGTANQNERMSVGTIDNPAWMCRKFHVTQEWQPDVVVRSRRRLQKNEGIVLLMLNSAGSPAGLDAFCNVHFRVLTK